MGKSLRLVFFFLVALTGCDFVEVVDTAYPSMAAAASRGGVSSGWVPRWLPGHATALREVHDIDTNESALAFSIPESPAWRPPSQCQPTQPASIVHSRFDRSWWPAPLELGRSYTFYRCPTDVPATLMFVGVHQSGLRGVVWRVTPR